MIKLDLGVPLNSTDNAAALHAVPVELKYVFDNYVDIGYVSETP